MDLITLIGPVLTLAVTVAAVVWYRRQVRGQDYYRRYPAATLLDDAAKQGKAHLVDLNAIGASPNVAAEIDRQRRTLTVPQ